MINIVNPFLDTLVVSDTATIVWLRDYLTNKNI